tara:strand:- start:1181 stop:1726 length:546 start_codon:yes stop_codon:yes gene_type:complete
MSWQFDTSYVQKPEPVFTTVFEDNLEFNNNLKESIIEHRNNNPESNNSNVNAWHSSYLTHKETPKFNHLIDMVLDACSIISKNEYQCPDVYFNVVNLWCMMYEKNDNTKIHNHFPSDFACCYYVDVEPNCSPIIFENNFEIKPENGMLIIWPAILDHEVPPTNGKRICISMNIDKKIYPYS